MPRWWLAIGPQENWASAFELGNIWGLKSTGRPALMWETIAKGDRLLFYATVPIAGVIGFGTVRAKFKQDKPLWPQEVETGQVLWPLRFEFDIEYALPREQWQKERAATDAIRTLARGGFQAIEDDVALELIGKFGEEYVPKEPAPEVSRSLHEQIIQGLIEAGKFQNFIAEKEYKMNGERLDAVWRRVQRSVPTYAFEVQIGGDIYHALGKLKHAYDIWNSRIFIVAREQDRSKVKALLSGTFHEIVGHLNFINVEKFNELLSLKRSLRELESELGIL